ncbi:MAG: hypothetical protein R2818_08955 [Flavobacteriales bacterium]
MLASKGRTTLPAFGTYDYTAANNITAKYQDMGHAVCDFAHDDEGGLARRHRHLAQR